MAHMAKDLSSLLAAYADIGLGHLDEIEEGAAGATAVKQEVRRRKPMTKAAKQEPRKQQDKTSKTQGGVPTKSGRQAGTDLAKPQKQGKGRAEKEGRHGPPVPVQPQPQQPHKPIKPQKKSVEQGSSWPFPTDYGDHFETSLSALRHIDPVLRWLAGRLGRKPSDLVIYDPYYCQGKVVQHWGSLGYTQTINRNRDFYKDIENNTVPSYDVLVTNPPYSADHKQRILDFCAASNKPWLLLMPNYVANKTYWQQAVAQAQPQPPVTDKQPSGSPGKKRKRQHPDQPAAGTSHAGAHHPAGATPAPPPPFYIVPNSKYEYEHPEGTGHASSPFFSIWFVHLGPHTAAACSALQHTSPTQWAGQARLITSQEALRQEGAAPAWKRPNPKQRKKLKKQKLAAS